MGGRVHLLGDGLHSRRQLRAHANTTLLMAIQVLAFVAPLLFTKSYTERAKAHGAQLAVATAGGQTP